jgi:hypothetical protein
MNLKTHWTKFFDGYVLPRNVLTVSSILEDRRQNRYK